MILDDIVKKQKIRIAEEKKTISFDVMKDEAEKYSSINKISFKESLKSKDFAFICEIKKASPSKGIIVDDFPYIDIAKEYESAGAAAISVLTEPNFFKGNDKYLQEVSNTVNIPTLRKDFIIDEYQIYQAKIIGASAVLLICAILDEKTLNRFLNIAHSLKLDCLVETHNETEIKTALNCGAEIIGINNRDLQTFTVDLKTSLNLKKYIPQNSVSVSESGIKIAEDIKVLKDAGFNAALIGESMMKSKNKQQFLLNLKGEKYEN